MHGYPLVKASRPAQPAAAEVEETTVALRQLARRVSDALWNLESATSLLRKAESGAYRSSETTGDHGWNPEPYRVRQTASHEIASRLLKELGK